MKKRDWEWRLATGETVRAELDLSSKVESVWLGARLVSRADAGAKPDGHVIPLGGGAAGAAAHRGASEARVSFDTFDGGLASCVLTVDGQTIAPMRAPRPLRAFALPSFAILVLAVLAARMIPKLIARTPTQGPFTQSPHVDRPAPPEPPPLPTTLDVAPTSTKPIPDADLVVGGLRSSFKTCYLRGVGIDPSMRGRTVITARVGSTGRVEAVAVVENDGLSTAVIGCIADAVKVARFTGTGEARTLRIPVSFVDQ